MSDLIVWSGLDVLFTAAGLVLLATAGAAFWILLGYPIALAAWPWRKREPIRTDERYAPSVTVLLAVFNGEKFLEAKLRSLLSLRYPSPVQILVLSDGSTDATDRIAESFASDGVRLIRLPRGGKAQALNRGIAEATGELLFFTDVRQPMDPDCLRFLAASFADPTVGAVTGELRYLKPGTVGEQAVMDLYWRYELWARSRQSAIDSLFGCTGCIYAVRRSLASPMPLDTLADDAWLPLMVFRQGFRVVFEPRAIAYDYPTVEGTEFPRRTRTLAGVWQIFQRLPFLYSGSNRMRLHFLTHKLGRLLLPWLLLTALVATLLLPPSPLRTLLLGGFAAIAGLALLDLVTAKRWPWKRLTSPARSFLVMNAAAATALKVFWVPPQQMWQRTKVATADPARPTDA